MRKRSVARWLGTAIVAAILGWIGFDLYGHRSSDMRSFDPDEVARLETGMWRSYYEKERFRLFVQLAELIRTQYHLPFLRSNLTAYHGAKAAFLFKDGHNRADYERALPNLVSFYAAIHKVSDIPFRIEKAAQLELEWWIVHRERANRSPNDLERTLAELPAEIYRVPAERLAEHARLRAEAMILRDEKARGGGVNKADWAKIEDLLRDSWRSLRREISS